jgi:hypothetical protein
LIFNIYTRPDGAFLLVPECMEASRAAEVQHGPLHFCGTINSSEHPVPALWNRVLSETDDHSFAVLQESVGKQLLDIRCRQ